MTDYKGEAISHLFTIGKLRAERDRLRDALTELKYVVGEDMLAICQEHGGDIWMAESFRIENVFARVDQALTGEQKE